VDHQALEFDRPFPESLQMLSRLALAETGAEGFAVYLLDAKLSQFVLKYREGVDLPQTANGDADRVVSYDLNLGDGRAGLLSFVFSDKGISSASRLTLSSIAKLVESVWQFADMPASIARLAFRVGELEVALAEGKLIDRLAGFLEDPNPSNDLMSRLNFHVENLRYVSDAKILLSNLEGRLRTRLRERQLISQAKRALCVCYGYPEEQAYLHLQNMSRETRTRLPEIARSVISELDKHQVPTTNPATRLPKHNFKLPLTMRPPD
jgi:hypothetical protein